MGDGGCSGVGVAYNDLQERALCYRGAEMEPTEKTPELMQFGA